MRCLFCGHAADATLLACPACGRALPPPPVGDETVELSRPPSHASASNAPTTANTPLSEPEERPAPARPFQPGQIINNRYRVIRLLGQGGMGAVYQAWDDELNVPVAIKTLLTHDEDASHLEESQRRFKRELLLARAISHKHVVRIYDLGEAEGIKFISMPYIRGEDLAAVIKRGPVPIQQALMLARQIASGLVAAHEAGVIHRDLKPANIMIENGERALLMDFGIARSVTSGSGPGTRIGAVIGTTEYMAPEQARAEPVDGRADIYAFGLILYEMLAGRRQLSGESIVRDLVTRMTTGPKSVRSISPHVPEALDAVVSKCVQPKPEDRYQTSTELVAALNALDADGHAIIARTVRPSLAKLAAAVIVLIAAAAGITRLIVGGREAPAAAHEPVTLLIADFENRTRDPVFDGSLEAGLSLAMEGASFISAFSRDSAQAINARLRPGSPLDPEGARLVSQREGIKVILAGAIDRKGDEYEVSVRAIDPIPGTVVATASATADNKGEVLDAVNTVAARLRTALGDTTTESGRLAAGETFTAASLEAAQEYARAQQLHYSAKNEEAIAAYRRALEHDPEMGRAYAGWALVEAILGRTDEAEALYKQALARLDRMTEREKFRTLGTYYNRVARNPDKAIENFSLLVEKYPADASALNNLAVAHFRALHFADALRYGKQLVSVYPEQAQWQYNYALYAMYAGDFEVARVHGEEALKRNADIPKAYMAVAMAALSRGDIAGTLREWDRAAKSSVQGASLAALGIADVALYQGRHLDAATVLEPAAERDRGARNTAGFAAKRIALAEAHQLAGDARRAVAIAQDALKINSADSTIVAAARLLLASGRRAEALALAGELGKRLNAQGRAYGKLIEGEVALRDGRTTEGIELLRAGVGLADLWLLRYALGIAHVHASGYAEAIAELERCVQRRGEGTSVFLNDEPTWRYMAPLTYWLARAREGAGRNAEATEGYKQFLALRPSSPNDPMVVDARRRLGNDF
jgi:tetratricopeptide (TPR) repeat protein